MRLRLLLAGLTLLPALLPFATVSAQTQLELVDQGLVDDDFADEVRSGSTDRAREFLAILGQGMLEQAYTLQHNALQGSALMPGPTGLQLGIRIDTFPLHASPENLLGKEENTKFIPVLPRISIGYAGGEAVSWAIGYSVVPPVPAQGASALVMGVDGSVAKDLGSRVRAGLDVDLSLGHAIAPVTATPEQYENGDLGNTDEERYLEVCAPQEYGCLDTLSFRHFGVRAGALFKVSEVVQPYVKVGITTLYQTFHVQVDLSSWKLTGLQPNVALGTHLALTRKLRTAVGASLAPLPAHLSDSGVPLLWRLELGLSYVM